MPVVHIGTTSQIYTCLHLQQQCSLITGQFNPPIKASLLVIRNLNRKWVGRFRFSLILAAVGTYRYPDGNVYDGEWRDDVRHGRGKFF